MTRSLLVRGMLVGLLAGLLAFAFALWAGEPQVERAIAFETSMDRAQGISPEPEMVSRKVQKSFGLLTGLAVYGTAIGGLFGLVFAFANGRLGIDHPRTLSAVLAVMGFVAMVVVPTLKYPANPPSVGNPETIGARTAAFFLLIVISVAAMVLALQVRHRLAGRLGGWNSSLSAAALFLFLVVIVSHFLPVFDEVPSGFPVTLMWRFRIAALGIQAVIWATVGLLFGWLTEQDGKRRRLRN
jgi:Probable cobalt transporter subunit (CbtA)